MNTQERITYAAFILFLENGYKSTTYDELIRAVGLSKGAFYHYFRSKEELFFAVIDRYFSSFFDRVVWADYEALGSAELEKVIQEYYRAFTRRIGELTDKGLARYFILFFEAMESYPAFREKAQAFYTRMNALVKHVSQGSTDGSDSVDLIAKYEGYLFWLAVFPNDSLDELIK